MLTSAGSIAIGLSAAEMKGVRMGFLRRRRAAIAGASTLSTVAVACALMLPAQSSTASDGSFNFDTGNAPVEVVIPRVATAIRISVSPNASDATLVLRVTALVHQAWFDSIAPYHRTAVGVSSDLGRRPAAEGITNRNRNIALLYATYRVLQSVLPKHDADWREMLTSVGLDPDDGREDRTSAIGIGNLAGRAIVADREHDGMNQLGDEGARKYNRRPYADYTGYEPVNTAYELKDPSRWQPLSVDNGHGTFEVQEFVTPQLGRTRPYSYDDPNEFRVPPPSNSNPNSSGYKRQVDEVLAASASLTDAQKMTAELFDDKITGLGFPQVFAGMSRGLSLERQVEYLFAVDTALWDTAIAAWNEKYRHDAVRPVSAIRYLYGDRNVTSWGGRGKGTVNDMPATAWRSYLNTANHPEYPSGSAAFCAAQAEVSQRFFGSDVFGYSVTAAKGSSRVEPGVTPANDTVLTFPTFSDFERRCALSRLWGGVHFRAAIEEGRRLGHRVAAVAHDFARSHIDGTSKAP